MYCGAWCCQHGIILEVVMQNAAAQATDTGSSQARPMTGARGPWPRLSRLAAGVVSSSDQAATAAAAVDARRRSSAPVSSANSSWLLSPAALVASHCSACAATVAALGNQRAWQHWGVL